MREGMNGGKIGRYLGSRRISPTPSSLLDWDECEVSLKESAMKTGFRRYTKWHRRLLTKRTYDESANASDDSSDFRPWNGGPLSKRGRHD
jgi:hypothetical protein